MSLQIGENLVSEMLLLHFWDLSGAPPPPPHFDFATSHTYHIVEWVPPPPGMHCINKDKTDMLKKHQEQMEYMYYFSQVNV